MTQRDFRGQRGFTLLEVLIATSVLAIAVVVVIQLFSANLRGISLSDDYVSAVVKANIKMREVLDSGDFSEGVLSEKTDDGYRIDITMTEALTERTETLPVRIFEIDLTVFWEDGIREKSYTLKTMQFVQSGI
jgi:prepilin-type N-terminal cleavage/methylation domain-containing protein